jgi:hypothetical protein
MESVLQLMHEELKRQQIAAACTGEPAARHRDLPTHAPSDHVQAPRPRVAFAYPFDDAGVQARHPSRYPLA